MRGSLRTCSTPWLAMCAACAKKKPARSQEEVASEATLHRTEWGKIEQGKRDPRMSTMLIIAETLGVTLNDLAEGIAAPKKRKPSPLAKRKRP